MKRLLALLLCLACLFAVSCGNPYPPVESTKEEARRVMQMKHDGKTYTVNYELYRAFLLPLRDAYGEDAAAHRDELMAAVDARILEIYTTLALCEELGIKLYNKQTEEEIREYIRMDIEGDGSYEGYGSYEAYLAALKEQYLNYATAELLLRYSIGLDRLYAHYIGTYDHITEAYRDSALTVTDADVRAFYAAEDTARVMLIELPREVYTDEEVTLTHDTLQRLLASGGEEAMAEWLLTHTATAESVTQGELLTPYTLDNLFYADVTATALALAEGTLSEPIAVTSDESDSYFLIYRMDKPASYLDSHMDTAADTYRFHLVGRELARVRDSLAASMTVEDFLGELDILSVSMS